MASPPAPVRMKKEPPEEASSPSSPRRDREVELRRQVELLSIFNDIGKTLTSTLDLDEVLKVILERVSTLVQPRNWSLLLVDEPSRELVFRVAVGEGADQLREMRLKIGEGIAGWVAAKGEAVVIEDVAKDPRFSRKADEVTHFTTRSIVAVPLKSRGRVLGVLELVNPMEEGTFGKESLDILTTLADYASIAIENARSLQTVKDLTIKDDLTSLFNSRYLQEVLDEELSRSQRYSLEFALVFFDLDHFKRVNDTHGHLIGSLVLKETADLVAKHLRGADKGFRYGGDEFVLLLPETPKGSAFEVCKRLRALINAWKFAAAENREIRLTASFGIAAYPTDAITKIDLIRRADLAMYRVKETTRDGIALA